MTPRPSRSSQGVAPPTLREAPGRDHPVKGLSKARRAHAPAGWRPTRPRDTRLSRSAPKACSLRALWCVREFDPDRRVIAGLLPAAHLAVHAGALRRGATAGSGADGRCAGPHRARRHSENSPRTCRSARPDAASARRRSSLARGAGERVAHLGPEQRVIHPPFRLVDVEFGRNHVVIAGQHDRRSARQKLGGMRDQPLEPAQLVCRISGPAQDCRWAGRGSRSTCRRSPLRCSGCGDRPGRRASRAGFRSVACRARGWRRRSSFSGRARSPRSRRRESRFAGIFPGLQFLQADDVGRRLLKPAQQNGQATVDAIDVEGCDPHGSRLYSGLGRAAQALVDRTPAPLKQRQAALAIAFRKTFGNARKAMSQKAPHAERATRRGQGHAFVGRRQAVAR